jgi:hypothetical protein
MRTAKDWHRALTETIVSGVPGTMAFPSIPQDFP